MIKRDNEVKVVDWTIGISEFKRLIGVPNNHILNNVIIQGKKIEVETMIRLTKK